MRNCWDSSPKKSPVDLGLLASPMGVLVSLTMKPQSRRRGGYSGLVIRRGARAVCRNGFLPKGRSRWKKWSGSCCTKQHRTVALAESCTGGLIGHRLTQVPGSSSYMDRGVICYSNKAKVELLGVRPELIEQYGAVSAEVAAAMAKGVRERSGVSVGLSVTGIAGPGGGTAAKPVGTGLHRAERGRRRVAGEGASISWRPHGDQTTVFPGGAGSAPALVAGRPSIKAASGVLPSLRVSRRLLRQIPIRSH